MPAVKIVLVGCGMWGRNIARNLNTLGILAGVADINAENARRFAAEFDTEVITVDEALEKPGHDAIALVTAAPSHTDLAVRALDSGKAVFVEKPLALTVAEAERIADAAKAADKPVMVGHLIRHHPVFRHLLTMVEDGAIGTLRHIAARRIAPGRIRDVESVLYDLCPHDLALIAALTGMAEPDQVACQAICHVTAGVDDIISAQLSFGEGVTATLEANWYNPVKIHQLTVIGSEAALIFDDTRPWPEKLMRHAFRAGHEDGMVTLERGEAEVIPVPEGEPLREEMANFADAVAGQTEPLTGIDEALYVQRIMARMQDAIDQSKLSQTKMPQTRML
ncbi:MAG TPA: gfo/Idh/MocA family oxidoreductase [Alphaproteobacteria bacterium]|nr:gfo/Idh/MocA family oxidoreductase [Alphaproteobacteria bacterium]